MSGIDVFIAVLAAIMFFGGLYLSFLSKKLVSEYQAAHKVVSVAQKAAAQKTTKTNKK